MKANAPPPSSTGVLKRKIPIGEGRNPNADVVWNSPSVMPEGGPEMAR